MEKLLILNPGSTSTKIAVFEDETPLFTESITHTPEELAAFDCVADQYEFRRDLVIATLKKHGVALESLTGIVSRGGLLPPIEAGAYEVNDDMVWQLKNKPQNEHASNVGAMIARALSKQYGIPAFIYDGITVDELLPINKITGLPGMRRKGHGPQPEHPAPRPCATPGRTERPMRTSPSSWPIWAAASPSISITTAGSRILSTTKRGPSPRSVPGGCPCST